MRNKLKLIAMLAVVVVVALVAWLVNYLFWFGADAPQVDYQAEMRAMQASATGTTPEDFRAHEILLELADVFDELANEDIEEPMQMDFQRWEDLQDPVAKAVIENWITSSRDRGVSELLDEFAGLTGFVEPWDSVSVFDFATNVTNGAVRAAVRVGLYDAELGLTLGETQIAVDEAVRTSRVARQYLSQPFAINRLVGHGILSMSIRICRDALAVGVSEPNLKLLAEEYESTELFPIETIFDGERLVSQAMITEALPNNRTLKVMSRGAQRARLESEYGRVQTWARLSAYERARSPFQDATDDWRYLPADVFVPSTAGVVKVHDHMSTDLNGIRLQIAIERYRLATGTLPATLDVLQPGYIDEIPVDIFAEDEPPFRYRVLDAPDENGRDYLLYSVGYDGVDNGGAEPEESAVDALSPEYEGTDFIVNRTE